MLEGCGPREDPQEPGQVREQEEHRSDFKYAVYLTAMVDLLGTTALVKSVPAVPLLVCLDQGPAAAEDAKVCTKRAATTLASALRDIESDLTTFFESAKAAEKRGVWASALQATTPSFSGATIEMQPFSDGLIVFTSISDREHQVPFLSVFSALTAISQCFLNMLYRKHPIRVGVGIGWGAQPADGRVVGACVESSYRMESEVAGYPRIAIHEDVVRYLDFHTRLKVVGDQGESEANKAFALRCDDLIFRDDDDIVTLDYLKAVQIPAMRRKGAINPAPAAYEFVERERRRFRCDGQPRLADRYARVQRYFDSRRALWDLPPKDRG